MTDNHPLTRTIQTYCEQYDTLREENLSLEPVMFHRRFGLVIKVPPTWNLLNSIQSVINTLAGKSIVVIFGSTDHYRAIHNVLGDSVNYFSWHEIFTAIHTASSDMRYIQRTKHLLAEADYTFFIDPPSIPEVMDQVCGQTMNCLVVLSGGA